MALDDLAVMVEPDMLDGEDFLSVIPLRALSEELCDPSVAACCAAECERGRCTEVAFSKRGKQCPPKLGQLLQSPPRGAHSISAFQPLAERALCSVHQKFAGIAATAWAAEGEPKQAMILMLMALPSNPRNWSCRGGCSASLPIRARRLARHHVDIMTNTEGFHLASVQMIAPNLWCDKHLPVNLDTDSALFDGAETSPLFGLERSESPLFSHWNGEGSTASVSRQGRTERREEGSPSPAARSPATAKRQQSSTTTPASKKAKITSSEPRILKQPRTRASSSAALLYPPPHVRRRSAPSDLYEGGSTSDLGQSSSVSEGMRSVSSPLNTLSTYSPSTPEPEAGSDPDTDIYESNPEFTRRHSAAPQGSFDALDHLLPGICIPSFEEHFPEKWDLGGGDLDRHLLQKIGERKTASETGAKPPKFGYVYLFRCEADPVYVKIGMTTQTVGKRLYQIKTSHCRWQTYRNVPYANQRKVHNPVLVEALVHNEFHDRRRRFSCKCKPPAKGTMVAGSSPKRSEWFQVSDQEAAAAILRWADWVDPRTKLFGLWTCPAPFSRRGALRTWWREKVFGRPGGPPSPARHPALGIDLARWEIWLQPPPVHIALGMCMEDFASDMYDHVMAMREHKPSRCYELQTRAISLFIVVIVIIVTVSYDLCPENSPGFLLTLAAATVVDLIRAVW